jgi:bifunctional UDP-N-acetylglucosamine pyrophosphorylase/glucosamine-1-phosphate N-acetyltransferase
MLWYSLDAARQATQTTPVVVVGRDAEAVRQAAGEGARFAIQEERLGTGHAAQQAESLLRGQSDLVLVLNADLPLMTPTTLQALVDAQQAHPGPVTLLTLHSPKPRGFGRIVRDSAGQVRAIIEEAHATQEQLALQELNVGAYCFSGDWLWPALARIPISPKGEYYLTDLVEIALAAGQTVQTVPLADPDEAIGINNRVHLAEAEHALRNRINRRWMEAGVTMVDPFTTYIETGVTIGPDTVIWPNTSLQGETNVGSACQLGPNSIIRDSQLGDRCRVLASVMEYALLEDDVDIGPFGRLRKGAHLAQGVHMGNFGEVKNAYLGAGTKLGHFSYIGDATIGPEVNIGAGTITCNYDGKQKHHTEIGAGAFIGSDTMLVAPLKLGEGVMTGAGSVVTKDIPAYSLAVGAPARAIRKLKKGD